MASVEYADFLEAQVAVGIPIQSFEIAAAVPLDGAEFAIAIDIGVPEVTGDAVSLWSRTSIPRLAEIRGHDHHHGYRQNRQNRSHPTPDLYPTRLGCLVDFIRWRDPKRFAFPCHGIKSTGPFPHMGRCSPDYF